MPEEQTNKTSKTTSSSNDNPSGAASFSPVVGVNTPAVAPKPEIPVDNAKIMSDVVSKINDSHNILVALSSDPSVDEMAAAIGLSLYLDRVGKHTTAIYSGATPNALEFLKPEDTFEATTDTLQDFVIALNKEKADHLRYKLDGDFVKIFITPYRSRIAEEDLEFSYGDFNIDLAISLNVENGVDLDAALREHGRIMHDASVINITAGNPGKFGEIEWSDKKSSSVSEMVARLLYELGGDNAIEPAEATAFLTGIIAATDRFSKANTTPSTMQIASRLMESGANQQLISENITADLDNQMRGLAAASEQKRNDAALAAEKPSEEPAAEEVPPVPEEQIMDIKNGEGDAPEAGTLSIEHEESEPLASDEKTASDLTSPAPESTAKKTDTSESATPAAPEPLSSSAESSPAEPAPAEDSALLDELNAAAASLANNAGAEATPEVKDGPVRIEDAPAEEPLAKPEVVIAPPADFVEETSTEGDSKYGQMLSDALAEVNGPFGGEPIVTSAPIVSPADSSTPDLAASAPISPTASAPIANPATAAAPMAPATPEINGVPEMNYMPLPGEEVLPPPPTPPIDMSTPLATPPVDAPTPIVEPATPGLAAPIVSPADSSTPDLAASAPTSPTASVSPSVNPAPADPGAFKIPGI